MIIGRYSEMAAVDAALARACAGSTSMLHLCGPLGSGKSTLLEQAARCGVERDMTVLRTQGRPLDRDIAFAGLVTLLRPVHADLDDLAGPDADHLRNALTLGGKAVDPLAVWMGVFRTLSTLAERRPLLVLVDDRDLLDPATTDVLTFVAGRMAADAVAVVSAGVDPAEGVLALGAMPADELAAVVRAHVADCAAEPAARCATLAAGNPLTAVELARSLTVDERGGAAPFPDTPRPNVAIVKRFSEELHAADQATRRAMVVVAAAQEAEYAVVEAALAELGEPPDGLDRAEELGFVAISDGSVRCAHPLLQPLAYHLVAASSRRAAHRALAAAMVRPDQAVARAMQLAECAVQPDETVAAALELVASDANRRGAAANAARTMQRAAALSPDPIAAHERQAKAVTFLLDADPWAAARLAEDLLAAATGLRADTFVRVAAAVELVRGPNAVAALADASAVPDEWRAALARRMGEVSSADAPELVADHPFAVTLAEATQSMAMSSLRAARGHLERARAMALSACGVSASWFAVIDAALAQLEGVDVDTALLREVRRDLARSGWLEGAVIADRVLARQLVADGHVEQAIDVLREAHRIRPAWVADDLATAHRAAAAQPCAKPAGRAEPDPFDALTAAEQRVAITVADGLTNKEAAAALFLSVKTIDFHLQGIYRKLAVRSRTELAVRLANRPSTSGGVL
jgi:DNA-binding CsgD family transcriptional regulator